MTSLIQREIDGYRYRSFITEDEGLSYEFDPVKQAMKDAGITELSPETLKRLAVKILQYRKAGRIKAETGLKLKKMKRDYPDPEERAAYVGRWKSSLIRRLTSLSNSLEKALMSEYSCLSKAMSSMSERISSGVPRYSTSSETTSSGTVVLCLEAKSSRTENMVSSISI
jgi:hypothetical protein